MSEKCIKSEYNLNRWWYFFLSDIDI